MKNDQYLTIKEFAEKANVSTQSIYKRLNNNATDELHKFTKVANKKKLINITALELYLDEITMQSTQPKNNAVAQHSNQINNQLQSEIDFLKQQINSKDEQISKLNNQMETQLNNKDEQLKDLNNRLAESQKLNENNQILLKQSQDKVLELEAPKEKKSWFKRK